ncbi:MAG: Minf_1886 family protein [Phycisphaerae bacterium]|jgi:uncharacterized repeat protein (TIGR04138 family)
MPQTPENKIMEVIKADGRYPPEAFAFLLNEGLPRAVREVYGTDAAAAKSDLTSPREHHHVSGKQLCLSLRDQALEKWGLLAPTVLESWNIRATLDFGNMVYLLIKHNLMQKTAEDRIDDFRDVFDFNEAFKPTDDHELKA